MKTREKILHSMYKLIAVHGYEKTALSMICEELDIKKPSIYYYFKSKENMFIKVFEEIIFGDNSNVFDFEVKKEDYKEAVIDIGNNVIDSYLNDNELIAVMIEFYVQSRRIELLKSQIKMYDQEYKAYVERILIYGVEIGALNKLFDIKSNAEILLNTLLGAEFSILFDFGLDHKKVWETTIKRMFYEEENDV